MKSLLAAIAATTLSASPAVATTTTIQSNKIEENKNDYALASATKPNIYNGYTQNQLTVMNVDDKKDTYKGAAYEEGYKTNIKNQTGAGKNKWYENNVTDYSKVFNNSAEKDKWVANNRWVTLNIEVKYNTWNSWYGWSNPLGTGGKYTNFETINETFALQGSSTSNHDIKYYTDGDHSENERVKLVAREIWEGNSLKIVLSYQGLVKWQSGSNVKHAGIIAGRNSTWGMSKDYGDFDLKNLNASKILTTVGYGTYRVNMDDIFIQILQEREKLNQVTKEITDWKLLVSTNISDFNNVITFKVGENDAIVKDMNDVLSGKYNGLGTDMVMEVSSNGITLKYNNATTGRSSNNVFSFPSSAYAYKIATEKLTWDGISGATLVSYAK
ncbi:hypothetical protein [Mesoplasma lactucae]|uniref:Uncharacterized protein n=1 Tax=Mesoplasma lactucae ATCC 49193 TaxID=81460 RepID=A0A291IQZ7_9MOLU|nr:hypothetical protein [Mesoplasma lactucae]ATG97203.1 hypothetical protein CP520_00285 [Mesoplasma lactucae ATCC 49193]ATZ20355.1 hypothetical protein MLACT_v1c05340 [Mesoplasma lactucae ATCC 49193]MCL8216526.1 hypothetical protein [Mesoplasma lactucae ATCC 49193]